MKIAHLEECGPTPFAFTFKESFPAEDALDWINIALSSSNK
jgi:hypothetical protein